MSLGLRLRLQRRVKVLMVFTMFLRQIFQGTLTHMITQKMDSKKLYHLGTYCSKLMLLIISTF